MKLLKNIGISEVYTISFITICVNQTLPGLGISEEVRAVSIMAVLNVEIKLKLCPHFWCAPSRYF